MSVSEVEITPNRVLQRSYPWVVIAIAFLTVGIAFGARNALQSFWSRSSKSFTGAADWRPARLCSALSCGRSPRQSSAFFLIDSARESCCPAERSSWRLAL